MSYEKLLSMPKNEQLEESITDMKIEEYKYSNENIKEIINKYQKEKNGETSSNIAKEIILIDVNIATKCIKSLPRLIEIYIQIYLKCEWERVKLEAKKGIKAKFNFDKEFNKIELQFKDEISQIKKDIMYDKWNDIGRKIIWED